MPKLGALVDSATDTAVNQNNDTLETAFNNTLSRDGSAPNFMNADLDMNGNDILNVGNMTTADYKNLCNQFTKGNATQQHIGSITSNTYTPNCCNSNVHRLTLTSNTTIAAPTNALSGQVMNFIIKQDGTGNWTVTWNSVFKFPSGTAPTITAAAGSVDVVTMQYDATDEVWYCVASQNFS